MTVYVYATQPRPDFVINAPSSLALRPGVPTTSTVTVDAVNQFPAMITLTATAGPGATATISPSTLTGPGSATLTVSATTAGNYTVTITASGGGLTHSARTQGWATPIYAKLVTTNGTIVVELYPNSAPKTVANFVTLAKSGFYNNLIWHRIVKGFVIQTGDPNTRTGDRSTWGTGGSSQTVPLEIDSSLHNNVGYLGMARGQDQNSGSSQFYINLANNNSLDGQYTVFGKVISGMDVALTLGNQPVNSQSQPINPVYLVSVTISNTP